MSNYKSVIYEVVKNNNLLSIYSNLKDAIKFAKFWMSDDNSYHNKSDNIEIVKSTSIIDGCGVVISSKKSIVKKMQ
jgi:hypothetical protein